MPEDRITIAPIYESYTEDFKPTGKIVSYYGMWHCSCGTILYTENTTSAIVSAVLEGKIFAHERESPMHDEEW